MDERSIEMDDRFDRRELLLHLGNMLEALSCVMKTGWPDAPVAQLAKEEASLQEFEFLRVLAPKMTVAEFAERATSAFFLWPKELLEAELNRNALASTVQHDLFAGNPAGWQAYIDHLQKKVAWFGSALPAMPDDDSAKPVHDLTEEASPAEASTGALGRASTSPASKAGWPWTTPRPQS
jgi:hypothetical protein